MDENLIKQAIWNNAVWCDIICATHGHPGEFLEGLWICWQKAPPFYPNVVTLDKHLTAAQLTPIQELLGADLPGEWGIKDSFAHLDLTELGFRVLFDAEWIYLPASTPIPKHGLHNIHWETVSDEAALNQWEQAWRGLPFEELEGKLVTIFRPDLLSDNRVAIIEAYDGGQIVAGAIGLVTDQVVGVSNVFVPAEAGVSYRLACIAMLRKIFPNKILVGYESADDLKEMLTIGFKRIGPLRIWIGNTS